MKSNRECVLILRLLLIMLFFSLSSCYQNYLYVQQHRVDKEYLASTHVDTPDPRKEDPPQGQHIIISWDFPYSVYKEELALFLTVRFWDDTQDIITYPIKNKKGCEQFYFPNKEENKNKSILTYRIEVKNKQDQIVSTWKHQFWTEFIDIKEK